jgi:hypothetical protein
MTKTNMRASKCEPKDEIETAKLAQTLRQQTRGCNWAALDFLSRTSACLLLISRARFVAEVSMDNHDSWGWRAMIRWIIRCLRSKVEIFPRSFRLVVLRQKKLKISSSRQSTETDFPINFVNSKTSKKTWNFYISELWAQTLTNSTWGAQRIWKFSVLLTLPRLRSGKPTRIISDFISLENFPSTHERQSKLISSGRRAFRRWSIELNVSTDLQSIQDSRLQSFASIHTQIMRNSLTRRVNMNSTALFVAKSINARSFLSQSWLIRCPFFLSS